MMNPMVPGLVGAKMSASDPSSKIDFLDPPGTVTKKIKSAFCEEGNITVNPLLSFVQAVLIPISEMRLERLQDEIGHDQGIDALGDQRPFISDDAPEGAVFTIEKGAKSGGGFSHYRSFEELQGDFANKKVHPTDLKAAVTAAILRLLVPIQKAFEENEEWRRADKIAYPTASAEPKKKKVIFCSSDGGNFSDCTAGESLPSPAPWQGKNHQTQCG